MKLELFSKNKKRNRLKKKFRDRKSSRIMKKKTKKKMKKRILKLIFNTKGRERTVIKNKIRLVC